jgi:hypothetical protein
MRWTASAVALIGLLAGACGPMAGGRERDRAEVEALLPEYAEIMSAAYRAGDVTELGRVATEREVNRVRRQIAALAEEGRGLRPELISLRVESVDFNRATATAVTVETWNLKVVALGSETVVAESPAQENRIVYSLTHEDDRWWILARILRGSTEAF